MNFRQFEALYWIARLGSFHAAARHLETSQPAVSARFRFFFFFFFFPLFGRSTRKVKLTSKGHELTHHAAQPMTTTELAPWPIVIDRTGSHLHEAAMVGRPSDGNCGVDDRDLQRRR